MRIYLGCQASNIFSYITISTKPDGEHLYTMNPGIFRISDIFNKKLWNFNTDLIFTLSTNLFESDYMRAKYKFILNSNNNDPWNFSKYLYRVNDNKYRYFHTYYKKISHKYNFLII